MELRTIREGSRLVAATSHDLELLDGLRQGKPLLTRVTLDRSSELQRWYWAFVRVVSQAIGMPTKGLHVVLKARAGIVEGMYGNLSGFNLIVGSTRYDAMGDDEFRPYVEQVKLIVFSEYLAGVDPENVYRQVAEEMAEDKRRWRR